MLDRAVAASATLSTRKRERLRPRALLAALLDLAVAHLDDRLDRQRRSRAAPWRRRCGRPSSGSRACRARRTRGCGRPGRPAPAATSSSAVGAVVGARAAQATAIMPSPSVTRAAVDDASTVMLVGDRPGRELGALHRGRQRARERRRRRCRWRRRRRARGRPASNCARRRRGRLGQLRRVRAARPELGGASAPRGRRTRRHRSGCVSGTISMPSVVGSSLRGGRRRCR